MEQKYTLNQFAALFNDINCNQLWNNYYLQVDDDPDVTEVYILSRDYDHLTPEVYEPLLLPEPEGDYYTLKQLIDMFNEEQNRNVLLDNYEIVRDKEYIYYVQLIPKRK